MKRIAEEWAVSEKNQHKTRRKSRFLGPNGELLLPSTMAMSSTNSATASSATPSSPSESSVSTSMNSSYNTNDDNTTKKARLNDGTWKVLERRSPFFSAKVWNKSQVGRLRQIAAVFVLEPLFLQSRVDIPSSDLDASQSFIFVSILTSFPRFLLKVSLVLVRPLRVLLIVWQYASLIEAHYCILVSGQVNKTKYQKNAYMHACMVIPLFMMSMCSCSLTHEMDENNNASNKLMALLQPIPVCGGVHSWLF